MKNKFIKLILLGVTIISFVVIVRLLLHDDLVVFDTLIYNFVSQFRNPILTLFFKIITSLSSFKFLFTVSLLLFIIFKNKKYSILSFINLTFIVCVNQLLKIIFLRERPFDWMIIDVGGYSFPSGHAMVSTAFYGMLMFLISLLDIDNKIKKILNILLTILIVLICVSRIYLGVHYASDVIGGLCFSLGYLIIITTFINFYIRKKKMEGKYVK